MRVLQIDADFHRQAVEIVARGPGQQVPLPDRKYRRAGWLPSAPCLFHEASIEVDVVADDGCIADEGFDSRQHLARSWAGRSTWSVVIPVIDVINGGTGKPGSMSCENSSTTSPSSIRIAPISIMLSLVDIEAGGFEVNSDEFASHTSSIPGRIAVE